MTGTDLVERLPTGINGFDRVALGGLPAGRSTLVAGTTGSGKTLFAVEFLARGIQRFSQPGVFVTFEESPDRIRRNFTSLGFPIGQWESEGKWAFVDASADIAEEAPVVGAYDFGGLTARIEHAAARIAAVRVSIDSLDAVFTRFADTAMVRHETSRIGSALKRAGITAVVTAERSQEYNGLSRYGAEFVFDNVIIVRNVLAQERRRRTVEVVKFRGAPHRSGEWLFTIDPQDGLVVIPLAFLAAPGHPPLTRVSTGNTGLDRMCGGGVFKDAVVLLTGPTGAGKTLTGLKFTQAGAAKGERCLFFTFDETREQLGRNAAGWGLDLDALEASGALQAVCEYPETASLEDHFIRITRAIEESVPGRLVIDTLSALERIVSPRALLDFVIAMGSLTRRHQITTLLTSLPASQLHPTFPSIVGEIGSLTDVTIAMRYFESSGEIRRAVAVLQSRGSVHDHAVRQATVDADGMHIGEPVTGSAGILAPSWEPERPAGPPRGPAP